MSGPRDPGDAWVEGPAGERYWGRFGAAGLLVQGPGEQVLLQHRATWSHHGGTWGIPGGALHRDESPLAGALREAHEEAGVPADGVTPVATFVADRVIWRYTTVLVRAEQAFTPVAGDAESLELRWVDANEVDALDLHPAFGRAWPRLRAMLTARPALLVDAANVVGARPDGWWRDRAAAAQRLENRLSDAASRGYPAAQWDLDGDRWHVPTEMVVEGQARSLAGAGRVQVTRAERDGDGTMVARAQARVAAGDQVTVVTSDRELTRRVLEIGARARGAGWLLRMLDQPAGDTSEPAPTA